MNEDRFAAFLDAMVRGSAPNDPLPPADIARRAQATATDRLDGERRSAIWRELMSAHAHDTSTTGGPGPLSQPALSAPDAFNPWVRRRMLPASKGPRMGIVHEAMQTGITAMAIVAVVITAFVAFPILRGDEATPRVTPTAWAAAPTSDAVGVETASLPESSNDTAWLSYIRPEECRATSLSNDAYATIIAEVTLAPARLYGPVSSANPDDAHDVAETARGIQACELYGTSRQRQALETERHLSREQNDLENSLNEFPTTEDGIVKGKELSAQYPFSDSIDFIHVFDNQPPGQQPIPSDRTPFWVFQPHHTIAFQDGRIAIPRELAYWSGQLGAPSLQTAARLPWVGMSLLVFKQEGAEWRLDEVLPFCVGNCESYWKLWERDESGNLPVVVTPQSEPLTNLPQGADAG